MSFSVVDSNPPLTSNTNLVVINCALNSTLQDVKVPSGSGVFAYADSNDFDSVAANRSIAWRTFDDVLELQEYSLNRNLNGSLLKFQFKNTLILQNGVSVHETTDRVYILVTTLVSAHRLIFRHPNKLNSKSNQASTSTKTLVESPDYSIFHRDFLIDFENPANYVPLPTASQSSISGPASLYTASCSWLNNSLDAYFGVATGLGSLYVIKLPPLHLLNSSGNESLVAKIQTFDLKQNSFIGKFLNGFVPSIIKSTALSTTSSNVSEVAVSMFSYSTADDELIFVLCRDGHIRVLSLKRQEAILVHNLFAENSGIAKEGSQTIPQNVISMKCWYMDDDGSTNEMVPTVSIPNIIVHWSYHRYKVFTLLRVNLPDIVDSRSNLSGSGSFFQMRSPIMPGPKGGASVGDSTSNFGLVKLMEIYAPNGEFELLDYFIADRQLWALWQYNDNVNLQFFALATENDQRVGGGNVDASGEQPTIANDWVVVVNDATAPPEMSLKSTMINSKEYYLNEIFWRGHFSLSAIGRAICVLNRWPEQKLADAKVDMLVAEAIKLTDGMIRNQLENIELLSVEDYTRMELDSWHQLYLFCLEYYFNETKPMSIFVDHKTGVKGIVRRSTLEIVPQLPAFDDLIAHYFLLCKEPIDDMFGGDNMAGSNNTTSLNLFSEEALRTRLSAVMAPVQATVSGVFPVQLESSLYHLLLGMAAINRSLKDEDWINFEAFMRRVNNFSSKMNCSLAELAKEITENPEIRQLSDNNLDPLVSDFFDKCPQVGEAIDFLLRKITYDFFVNQSEPIADQLGLDGGEAGARMEQGKNQEKFTSTQEAQMRMVDALQSEIAPEFFEVLSSCYGLDFITNNVRKLVDCRYRFLRDMFLFQFMLSKFRMNLKSEDMPKIVLIEATYIPKTAQLLFALDYLNWVCQTPMVTANVAWAFSSTAPGANSGGALKAGVTSIVSIKSSPSSGGGSGGGFASATSKVTTIDNNELLAVLDMRDYINLNRLGVVGLESTFYDAYPASSILYFFLRFRGGLLVKRMLSYRCLTATQQPQNWASLISDYLGLVAQLLWPYSPGQFKLAEFLLGVGQYDLLERYVLRLNNWCSTFSYSRFFLKGIGHLVNGNGPKALRQFKQALIGVTQYEPFLFRIFAQKPAKLAMSGGHKPASKVLPNARTIFRYYNKLVQLFNRYSSPDQVIELVEVALDTLDRETDPEYDEHRNSLLMTLFANQLKLGNIQRAHEAMIDNTDVDQRRTCLRQFILNLCERGAISELVTFSYFGLEEEFVGILESKAKSSLVVAEENRKHVPEIDGEAKSINYYHILYAYFIRINEYQRAAQAMYNYYRRLVPETEMSNAETMLELQAEALLMARNCLALVAEGATHVVHRVVGNEESNKRKRHGGQGEETPEPMSVDVEEHIYSRDWLLSEYELISIRLALYRSNQREYAIAATQLSPDETQLLCIGAGFYEKAFRLARHFNLPLDRIFEGMASKYVYLLHHGGHYSQTRLDEDVLESLANLKMEGGDDFGEVKRFDGRQTLAVEVLEVLDMFYENAVDNGDDNDGEEADTALLAYSSNMALCDRMWALIMSYLRRYERQPCKCSRLLRAVAEKLLSNGVMVPPSLFKVYQRANCPELLRLLMTYDFLQEATDLAIDYMEAFMGHCPDQFGLTHFLTPNCSPLHMSLHIVELLINILRDEAEQDKLDDKAGWTGGGGGVSIKKCSDDGINSIDEGEETPIRQKVNHQELFHKASGKLKTLRETIKSCSKIL